MSFETSLYPTPASARRMTLAGILSRAAGGAFIGYMVGKYGVMIAPVGIILGVVIGVTIAGMAWGTFSLWDLRCKWYHVTLSFHSEMHERIKDLPEVFFPIPPRPRLYNIWLKYFYKEPQE